ncbi:MAG: cysteine--tRNA ligase [Devosiaceae bacterium]|nr:cysteine--tRNA ligase [Devosiaceae bacterium]
MSDKPQLKLYNTLTREKELFEPIDANNVRMYVCGPTVYDHAHIGNARPVIVFDVLFRLLRHLYGKDKVTYVRNITDVDDKINARALRDYPDLPLNKAIAKVTQKTTDQFHKDIKALGCLEPTHEPRATQHIEGMVKMIEALISKGNAYFAKTPEGGEVLFDVSSMQDYGKLSNRKLEDQRAGARVTVKSHKKNPGDFVLWKLSSDNEPGWPSPWGVGRPGWHIECSVMSEHHLGKTFDIHGGGLDLIFPHHENEIAQSRCAHGNEAMANVWMHNGFLQVEGKKMSKSDGNFVTIADLLHTEKFGGRKWPGEVLRLAMLMTHYREPIDFSLRRLEEAEARRTKWLNLLLATVFSKYDRSKDGIAVAMIASKKAHEIQGRFGPNLVFDDLSLNVLLSYFDGTVKDHNSFTKAGKSIKWERYLNFFFLLNLLGCISDEDITSANLAEGVDEKITQRLTHLANQDWPAADAIRDELLSQGIQLKDSKDSQTGERITTWEVKR